MKFLLLLLCLTFSISSFAQADLIEKKNKFYIYQGNIYKCEQMGTIYQTYPEALELYTVGAQRKSTSKVVGTIALGVFVVSAFSISRRTLPGVVLGVLGVGASAIIGIIASFSSGSGSKKLKEAQDLFNFKQIEKHGYNTDTSLSLALTTNGLGLVYSF